MNTKEKYYKKCDKTNLHTLEFKLDVLKQTPWVPMCYIRQTQVSKETSQTKTY